MGKSIADIRTEYKHESLLEKDVAQDPILQFGKWWDEAIQSDISEVNAMTLATCNNEGYPSARIVLLKGFDETGFIFFTNYESNKAKELEENPKAALVFFWKELERQVRIEGVIEKADENMSDSYFISRPHDSQVGAWASPQSKVIKNREVIEEKFLDLSREYAAGVIPRPQFWGGYIVRPEKMEFWQGRTSRLHDRILYTKSNADWIIERLAP